MVGAQYSSQCYTAFRSEKNERHPKKSALNLISLKCKICDTEVSPLDHQVPLMKILDLIASKIQFVPKYYNML
jgi:hypothetical protein